MVSESTAIEVFLPASTRPEPVAVKDGYVKVRLNFTTSEPKHVRSQMMQQIYHSKPPFIEDVCVLMPSAAVFTLLETFFPAFEWLKEIGVVSPTANLQEFKVLDEDTHTLAFLFK